MMANLAQAIKSRWYAVEDDLIAGWCISNVDKPCSEMDTRNGEYVIADCLNQEVAEYLCSLHNAKTWFEA